MGQYPLLRNLSTTLISLSIFLPLVTSIPFFEVQPNLRTLLQLGLPEQFQDVIVRSNCANQLITTSAEPASIRLLNLSGTKALTANNTLLYQFDNYRAVLGITKLENDIYAIVVGNTIVFPKYQAVPGTYNIYRLDLTQLDANGTVNVSPIAHFDNAKNIDSITTVPATPPVLLVADSTAGQILKVNVSDGASSLFLEDQSLKPVNASGPSIGINGLKYFDGYVYYTNTYEHALYRAPVALSISGTTANYTTLAPSGAPQLLIQDSGFPRADGLAVRNFGGTVGNKGAVDIAVVGSNTLVRVGQQRSGSSGWGYHVVAGGAQETTVAGATGVAFGSVDWQSVFVVTGGGIRSEIKGARGGAEVVQVGI
ncbi:hypothetical protein GQ43DRAFT_470630 [Delitschia confertaspora ATCC 74209]|uniref:NHL repeat protein n=1 Tax=Delitschia confertaspora ATCC 74209 TaxID=1513339 RepID=A0A9P4JPB7_9PLEO|nr:hypothetical protein GQ43DRAFT_470630 [Delitschia confertaspora ATCC 74209]